MLISSKRSHRRPDPLFLLLLFVLVGMGATVSYQVLVTSDAGQASLVRQPPPHVDVGG